MKSEAQLADILERETKEATSSLLEPVFRTKLGVLYRGDCRQLMSQHEDESFELIFADPPFNLSKKYPSGMNDVSELKQRRWIGIELGPVDEIITRLNNLPTVRDMSVAVPSCVECRAAHDA